MIFKLESLGSLAPEAWLRSLPAGLVLGWLAYGCDQWLLRSGARRRRSRTEIVKRHRSRAARFAADDGRVGWTSIAIPGEARPWSGIPLRRDPTPAIPRFEIWPLVLVAVFEELIYRGFPLRSMSSHPQHTSPGRRHGGERSGLRTLPYLSRLAAGCRQATLGYPDALGRRGFGIDPGGDHRPCLLSMRES